ncbi:DinB family protein [Spongiactinospora sp. TRM90649]|uniref:DinB family protein n=1 Tax=Spongiactinospora sp. TRM90649 TaxID=3031114 RepID=UPI0023F9AB94|nr:DinB family protein [Spongiactinospora sp. TRM90649]MDF5757470.1 DinB family protein [Spongiactinospora sp. TRM90649]
MTPPPPRVRPPFTADERTQLMGWYDMQRAIVHYKCEGVSEADAHRPVLPGSPLMTLAGLVSHLRWTEHTWFEVLFMGGSSEGQPQFSEDVEDADMRAEGVPLARLLDEYAEQCAASDKIIAAYSLDDTGRHPGFPAGAASLRWIVLHMVEETARHAGHLDVIRELLDGHKGYY